MIHGEKLAHECMLKDIEWFKNKEKKIMVRAKFKVMSVTNYNNDPNNYLATVTFQAIHGNDNRIWSKWTPSGKLELSITNSYAVDQFKLGECYFLDFSPAPAKESDESPSLDSVKRTG